MWSLSFPASSSSDFCFSWRYFSRYFSSDKPILEGLDGVQKVEEQIEDASWKTNLQNQVPVSRLKMGLRREAPPMALVERASFLVVSQKVPRRKTGELGSLAFEVMRR